MAIEDEVRRLDKKWANGGGQGWPKWLDWLEITGIRGWTGQRVKFQFPIVALVGENGSGKSTLLQAAACTYQAEESHERTWYPTEFFPDTAWDGIHDAEIAYGYVIGGVHETGDIRKPTERWLGQPERPKRRVRHIDLNRLQPVGARVGYARIAKTNHKEKSATPFDERKVKRFSHVMGKHYDTARMALSDIDESRRIPVITRGRIQYSGYHQGSGEITAMELLQTDLPKYGLVLIDEIESSLHPRVQRRLIRDLAEQCRERELQVILSTHSPYILEELPPQARMYILDSDGVKKTVTGVSPQFAMTKMDDDLHPEADIYVEDESSRVLVEEILARHGKEIFGRCAIIPFGAASVGIALGQMISNKRFPRPTCVFLDGDNATAVGCHLLPGGDAPERVVFNGLRPRRFGSVWSHIARDVSMVQDSCTRAMTLSDHHDWCRIAANQLMCSADSLWRALCVEWVSTLPATEGNELVQAIIDILP